MTLARLARGNSVISAGLKLLKVLAFLLLFYLLQASVVPHLKVLGVMPNLLMVAIAIITVSFGKQYAFIAGAIMGIILEAMAVSIPLFYVIIYPVLSLLCAQVFADMSDVKREMRRIREAQRQSEAAAEIQTPYTRRKIRLSFRRNSSQDMEPHLRILLNALMLGALYEGIMLIYVALGGVTVSFAHLSRVFVAVLYTGAASALMFPARAFLGMYRRRSFRANKSEEQLGINTDAELLRQLAIVPDDAPQEKTTRMKSVFKWRVEKKPLREEEPTESLDRVPRVDEAVKEAEK
ncbi:MAG: hypothetical protein GX124_04940 [Clostridiales bacterium]|nr:hypothetical protein [Clostridiales bacterium]